MPAVQRSRFKQYTSGEIVGLQEDFGKVNFIELQSPNTKCKICDGSIRVFERFEFNRSTQGESIIGFENRNPIIYLQCQKCKFVFTGVFDKFNPED